MLTRTINLQFATNEIDEIAQNIVNGAERPDTALTTPARARDAYSKVLGAIGHLTTWHSYPRVEIARDGETDLVARYYREGETVPAYVIGAVWHSDDAGHYGFHS